MPLSASPAATNSDTPIFDNLGSLHHPITTTVPLAQQYFDQGLRLAYAFNHEEAINSFEQAVKLDPQAAMAYWGIGLALGPNINAAMSPADGRRAYAAVQKAKELAERVTPHEKAYIEALSKRYSLNAKAKRAKLDEAYAKAMRAVAAAYPEDADAATLFAEALMDLHPWNYWTPEGRPRPWAEEIVATLEGVLNRNPDHPGACHYYIHAVEASLDPGRALPCAMRLPDLMPGAGHLVHMPAHIYMRTGRYHEAAERNEHASAVDHDYLEHRHLTGIYPTNYYPHNRHFLWAVLIMEGRSADAIRVGRELAAAVPVEVLGKDPGPEVFLSTAMLALARFGRWDEILKEPPPPRKLRFSTGMWRFTRGLALTSTGRFGGGEGERRSLVQLIKQFPKGGTAEAQNRRRLLQIAERVLAGELATRRARYDDAVRAFKEALRLESALPYMEPPLWYQPVRHNLGAALLAANRPVEAERVYREDLVQHPENGWALYGLAASLKAQNKAGEAAAIEERFKQAWARADVALTASRF